MPYRLQGYILSLASSERETITKSRLPGSETTRVWEKAPSIFPHGGVCNDTPFPVTTPHIHWINLNNLNKCVQLEANSFPEEHPKKPKPNPPSSPQTKQTKPQNESKQKESKLKSFPVLLLAVPCGAWPGGRCIFAMSLIHPTFFANLFHTLKAMFSGALQCTLRPTNQVR